MSKRGERPRDCYFGDRAFEAVIQDVAALDELRELLETLKGIRGVLDCRVSRCAKCDRETSRNLRQWRVRREVDAADTRLRKVLRELEVEFIEAHLPRTENRMSARELEELSPDDRRRLCKLAEDAATGGAF